MSFYPSPYSTVADQPPTYASAYERHEAAAREHCHSGPTAWRHLDEGNALGLHNRDYPGGLPPPAVAFKTEPCDYLPPPPMVSSSSATSQSSGSYLPTPSGGSSASYFSHQPAYAVYPSLAHQPAYATTADDRAQYSGHLIAQPQMQAHYEHQQHQQRLPSFSASQRGVFSHPIATGPSVWQAPSDRQALTTPSEGMYGIHGGSGRLYGYPSPDVVQPDGLSPGSGEATLSPAQDLHVQLPAHLGFLSLQPGQPGQPNGNAFSQAQQHQEQSSSGSYFCPPAIPGSYLHQPMPSRAFGPPEPFQAAKGQFGLGISTVEVFERSSPPPVPDSGFAFGRRPSTADSSSADDDDDDASYGMSPFSGTLTSTTADSPAAASTFIPPSALQHKRRSSSFITPLPECPESPPPLAPLPVLREAIKLPPAGRGQPIAASHASHAQSSSSSAASSSAPDLQAMDATATADDWVPAPPGKRTHSCQGCRKSKNRCDAAPPAKGSGVADIPCKSCARKGIDCEFLPLNKRGMSKTNPLRIYMESQQRKLLRRQSSHGGQLPTRQSLSARGALTSGSSSPSLGGPSSVALARDGSATSSIGGVDLTPADGQASASGSLSRASSLRVAAPRRMSAVPSTFPYPTNSRRESAP